MSVIVPPDFSWAIGLSEREVWLSWTWNKDVHCVYQPDLRASELDAFIPLLRAIDWNAERLRAAAVRDRQFAGGLS
jgi:hypothetical protein